MKLYSVAFHKNRLDEAILIDDTMYSLTGKCYKISLLFETMVQMYIMNAKIKMRQYVIFIKSRNFNTAGINFFAVHILSG